MEPIKRSLTSVKQLMQNFGEESVFPFSYLASAAALSMVNKSHQKLQGIKTVILYLQGSREIIAHSCRVYESSARDIKYSVSSDPEN